MQSQIGPQAWAIFASVVFIWSTTPLAIVISNQTIDPFLSLSLRMLLSLILLSIWFVYQKRPLPLAASAWPTHFAVGGIGIGLSMSLVYLAAQQLPSSWIALIFGLAPLFTGILEGVIFRSLHLKLWHWLGIVLAIYGLWIIFHDPKHQLHDTMTWSIIAMLASTFFHALSASLLKRTKVTLAPVDTVMGGLLMAIPMTLCFWWLNGFSIPSNVTNNVAYAIIYLGVIGSLAGFLLYYKVLTIFSATMSSFITLLAPTLALIWGALVNNEPITPYLMVGAFLILLGLAVFIMIPADKHR